MKWLWTWGGHCFGYRDEEDLWTYGGQHVGKFHDDEIYGTDGGYLGEVKSENRLITNLGKKSRRKSTFSPYGRRGGFGKHGDYGGYGMLGGYEDFPKPETFV